MCGIFGVGLKEDAKDRVDEIIERLCVLALASETRGRSASGFAFLTTEGVKGVKNVGATHTLLGNRALWTMMETQLPKSLAVIGHARAETQGTSANNHNNHPITCGHITGIHNGMIRNYNEAKDSYPLRAQVDSELIFSMINEKSKKKDMQTSIRETWTELSGSMAIAFLDDRDSSMWLFRGSNPLEYVITEKGDFWFASDDDFLEEALMLKNAFKDIKTAKQDDILHWGTKERALAVHSGFSQPSLHELYHALM